jgi:hypothetical protein
VDVGFYSRTTLMLCLDGEEGDVGGLMNLILEFFFLSRRGEDLKGLEG